MSEIEDIIPEEELYQHHRIVVDRKQEPLRIDKFLTNRFANITRNRVKNTIDSGAVLVDDKPVKSNHKVKGGQVISVVFSTPPTDNTIIPEDIPLDIIYEDDHILLINKPPGMVVHPGVGNKTGTMANGLAHHLKGLKLLKAQSVRPGIVHRIDKYTSGILVVGKTEQAVSHLSKQFFDHSIQRKYIAIAWGDMDESGTIDYPIARHPNLRKKFFAFKDYDEGKHAVTHFKTIENLYYISVLECQLETGRTHQIRVHLNSLGNPVFNDFEYDGDKIRKGTVYTKYKQFVHNCFKVCQRQALHAKSLGLIHPHTKEFMHFEVPLPEDMSNLLEKWRHYAKHTTQS